MVDVVNDRFSSELDYKNKFKINFTLASATTQPLLLSVEFTTQ